MCDVYLCLCNSISPLHVYICKSSSSSGPFFSNVWYSQATPYNIRFFSQSQGRFKRCHFRRNTRTGRLQRRRGCRSGLGRWCRCRWRKNLSSQTEFSSNSISSWQVDPSDHHPYSLIMIIHLGFQNQPSKSGNSTPKTVNSLAAIAGNEGDEEPWKFASYADDDEVIILSTRVPFKSFLLTNLFCSNLLQLNSTILNINKL